MSKDVFIQTFTGKQFYPLNPAPESLCIEDIIHALSHQCRFSGHTVEFYSVGDHSIRVAEYLESRYPNEPQLWLNGLMHDASEAYIVDIPRPIKHGLLPQYVELERGVERAIQDKFHLTEDARVKEADDILLVTEARDLIPGPKIGWRHDFSVALKDPIRPRPIWTVQKVFFVLFESYTNLVETRRAHGH